MKKTLLAKAYTNHSGLTRILNIESSLRKESAIVTPRVMILISTSSGKPFQKIRVNGQESTWIKTVHNFPTVEYRYLTSTDSVKSTVTSREETHTKPDTVVEPSRFNKLVDETETELQFESSGGWESILSNSLSGMQWALSNSSFDFLIRTNVSSYWDIGFTLELLNKLPKSSLYAGQRVFALGTELIEGSGIIFSRDVVEEICKGITDIDANTMDDVAFGRFLAYKEIPLTHIPRLWVRTLFDAYTPNLQVIRPHTIRCKFERNILGVNFRRDAVIMRTLHSRLNNISRKLPINP